MLNLPADHDVFLDVFDGAPSQELAAGEVLLHAGAPADHVYNIESGMLMVSRAGGDGRRQVLSFLVRDNFVGLTATDHYFFTVEAVMPSRVAGCPRRVLTERLASDPEAERTFMNMLFRVLEDAYDLVYNLGQRTAVERLAVFLLYMRHWKRVSEKIELDADAALDTVHLPMSREDIADFLGLKKETVSRSFRQLEERRLISRGERGNVTIEALEALRDLAGIRDFASPRRLTARG
ncbi:MAG: Crp/Fnr family transcriptional regulator [Gammaproteobacteria bacterium]